MISKNEKNYQDMKFQIISYKKSHYPKNISIKHKKKF